MNRKLIAFSGLMMSGKDTVANHLSLKIFGFADPLYELCEHFTGTRDKSVPGVRRLLQQLGQWGWGCNDNEYPFNADRAAITELIRENGMRMTKSFGWVDWSEYGRRTDFWVNIVLCRLGLSGDTLPPNSDTTSDTTSDIGIVNARFLHEMDPIKRVGFQYFHIMCSEETRRERMVKKGYVFDAVADKDKSELMAWGLNKAALAGQLSPQRIIWNDHRTCPIQGALLVTDDLCKKMDAVSHADKFHIRTQPAMPVEAYAPA